MYISHSCTFLLICPHIKSMSKDFIMIVKLNSFFSQMDNEDSNWEWFWITISPNKWPWMLNINALFVGPLFTCSAFNPLFIWSAVWVGCNTNKAIRFNLVGGFHRSIYVCVYYIFVSHFVSYACIKLCVNMYVYMCESPFHVCNCTHERTNEISCIAYLGNNQA